MMKLIFTVKSTMQVNDSKMLVQLAGKHGHLALDLPLGHRIAVGQEFVVQGDVVSLGEIDEVAERDATRMAPAPAPASHSKNLISLGPENRHLNALARKDLLD
jgi:hypothetical protein